MNSTSLLFGALRTHARGSPRTLQPLVHFRSLSKSTSPLLRLSLHVSPKPQHPSILTPSRLISLSSIFGPRKVVPTPSPAVVASIATLEADANAHPQDVQKQIALFEALLNTRVKAGYDVVIARWERMCEFDPENPLLRSDEAFKLYLTALSKNGLEASVPSAVRRRDALLAASTGSSSTNASSTGTESNSPDVTSSGSNVSVPTPSAPSTTTSTSVKSSSQQVADAVLSGSTPLSSGPQQSLGNNITNFAAALKSGAGTPEQPIVVTIQESRSSLWPGLIRFFVLTALGAFFVLVLLAVLLENSGLMKAGPRQAEFEPSEGKTYRFSDVHGVDEAKEELQEVVEFLKDPTSFATLGGKLPKGILLTGPPGTGKTMLARAVAGEAGVPFLFASGSEFDEMFVGVGAKRVRDLFETARKKQPAIIFIDELDAIGGKRTNRDQHYMKQTLNQLLVEMDGFLETEGIIVIAATNFPDSLDPALVRPGRFDRHIAVPLPDVRGRVQILKHHMKNVKTAPEVDPTILARGTPGFSGADLQNMAAVQAARERANAVTLKHFEWAKDRIVMGAERRSSFISDEVKKMTAYHEGGHALVALYTDGAMPLHKVTCVPRGHALGITSQLPQDDRYSVSLKEYLAEIDVCMGGRVAEELIYGPENVTSGASSDIKHATRTARAMVKSWGYSSKIGPVYFNEREDSISPMKQDEIENEVRSLLIAGETRVTDLLKSKQEELHRLANALVEHETLDVEEVKKVIKGEPIRNINDVIKDDIKKMDGEQSEKETKPKS
ncbi:ATP-dependent metallopeptidase Hfl [Panus rudis PR-1116 ss-1]|nr:ATP-dependent metallopeptidase Hfl [Panus rudis PR-1116 ss-1]